MNVNQMFPSKYIAASDLAGQTVPVVISHCVLEQLDDGDKPVLFFQDRTKGLVLNKTNATVLADAFGNETEQWTGQTAELYSEMVNFKGKMVPGVRMRATSTAAVPMAAALIAKHHRKSRRLISAESFIAETLCISEFLSSNFPQRQYKMSTMRCLVLVPPSDSCPSHLFPCEENTSARPNNFPAFDTRRSSGSQCDGDNESDHGRR